MKDYTQYKRIIKFMSSAAIVAMEAGIYGFVWVTYYNRLLEFPFWRRGNWLMIAVYAVLLIFFEQMYGGFKVGFYKKWNVIYSQILALVIVNVITYLQIALIDKRFHSLTLMGGIPGDGNHCGCDLGVRVSVYLQPAIPQTAYAAGLRGAPDFPPDAEDQHQRGQIPDLQHYPLRRGRGRDHAAGGSV